MLHLLLLIIAVAGLSTCSPVSHPEDEVRREQVEPAEILRARWGCRIFSPAICPSYSTPLVGRRWPTAATYYQMLRRGCRAWVGRAPEPPVCSRCG